MASEKKQKRSMDRDMTKGTIWVLLVQFSVPLLFGYFFQQLYNTVDSVVVGNFVSKQALAAVGSTTSIVNMLIGVFTGFSTGASVVISQSYGAGDKKRVHDEVHTIIFFIFFLAAAFTVVGMIIVTPMLHLMATPEDVFGEAKTYLTIYFAGVSGLIIYNMGSAILRAVGDSKRPLYFLIFAAVLNTFLDLLFVISFHWGVAGVAWATIVAQFLTAILVLFVLSRSDACYGLKWKDLRIYPGILPQVLNIGFPTSIQLGLTSFSNVIVQSYINFFGSECMAGWASYAKIDQFMSLTLQSMSLAVTTFVGQNIGARLYDRVKKGIRTTTFLLLSCVIVEIAVVMVFAPQLSRLFSDDVDVIAYASQFVRLITPLFPFCCIANLHAGALRGAGDANASMIILLGSFVAFRQIYLFVMSHTMNTITAIALGYPAGWFVASVSIYIYYRVRGQKKMMQKCLAVSEDDAE